MFSKARFGASLCLFAALLQPGLRANDERTVTVLLMADTHAALGVHPEIFFEREGKPTIRPAGGYALLASAVAKERSAAPQGSLLVNVGDTLHGSAVAEWTQGAAIVPVVNALGIDVFVPGNWDYAYGPEVFRKRMSELNHPVAAINLYEKTTGKRLFAPSVVKSVNGVSVAVVGVTSVIVQSSMAPAYSRGLRFGFKEELQSEVDRLRAAGTQVVLLATELGLAQEIKLAREIRGVDFILGGHTHERTVSPVLDGGTPVIQAGSEGSFLARVRFRVKGGRVDGYEHELLQVTPDRYKPDPKVARIVSEVRRPYEARLKETVGRTETALFRKGVLESTMDNVIADALREATGADIGMTNGFRFSYPIPPGPVTQEDLFNMFPMDAGIKVGRLTGKQLREFWEDGLDQVFASDAYGQRGGWGPRPSGMTVRVRLGQPKGKRVVWMKGGEKIVRDEDKFTVASCDRPGDPADVLCRFAGASDTRVLNTTIQQAMRDYLRTHGVIRPAVEGRISAEDASGHVWSQYDLGRSSRR
jgi:S-sulfosulfanyl-L-cysteine sulfohydrolase